MTDDLMTQCTNLTIGERGQENKTKEKERKKRKIRKGKANSYRRN